VHSSFAYEKMSTSPGSGSPTPLPAHVGGYGGGRTSGSGSGSTGPGPRRRVLRGDAAAPAVLRDMVLIHAAALAVVAGRAKTYVEGMDLIPSAPPPHRERGDRMVPPPGPGE